MSGPKTELRQRIAAKITGKVMPSEEAAIVDAVMSLFYTVADYWDDAEITTFGDDGQVWLEQRWLVARIPVQSQRHERLANRTPEPTP